MTMTKLLKAMYAMRDIEGDDVLERIGLARRRSVLEKALTTIGIFGAGMVIGAGVGLLVSPVAPEDVRKKIGEGVRTVKNEINELVAHESPQSTIGSRPAVKNGAATT